MSRQPQRRELVTAAALLAHAQEGLHGLDLQDQAVADQVAEELRELFRLRQVRLTRPALLGFVVGVADLARLLDELGIFTDDDTATCQAVRNDLLLGVARLAQASTSPDGLDQLWQASDGESS